MADLPNVFASNAAKLKGLHEAIHTALARRNESPDRRAVWEEAVPVSMLNMIRWLFQAASRKPSLN